MFSRCCGCGSRRRRAVGDGWQSPSAAYRQDADRSADTPARSFRTIAVGRVGRPHGACPRRRYAYRPLARGLSHGRSVPAGHSSSHSTVVLARPCAGATCNAGSPQAIHFRQPSSGAGSPGTVRTTSTLCASSPDPRRRCTRCRAPDASGPASCTPRSSAPSTAAATDERGERTCRHDPGDRRREDHGRGFPAASFRSAGNRPACARSSGQARCG